MGLSRCELAEGTVRPGGVVMRQVLGQYLTQVVLVNPEVTSAEVVNPLLCRGFTVSGDAAGVYSRVWGSRTRPPVLTWASMRPARTR